MPNAGDYVRASDTTRYYCKATQGIAQSIPDNTFTALTFGDADPVDNLGLHDPVTNNSRITIGLNLGWWLVTGNYVTTANTGVSASHAIRARITLNGAGVNGGYQSTPFVVNASFNGGFWTLPTTTMVQSTVSTDYVELSAYQNTGGALNTSISGELRSQLCAIYLGP